jgi:hypothetical protein
MRKKERERERKEEEEVREREREREREYSIFHFYSCSKFLSVLNLTQSCFKAVDKEKPH